MSSPPGFESVRKVPTGTFPGPLSSPAPTIDSSLNPNAKEFKPKSGRRRSTKNAKRKSTRRRRKH